MRFTIDKEQFLKGLLIAGRGIGAKNANPLLLCFKMEMTSIGLEITASNGDVTVFTRVPLKLNEKEIIRNYSLGSSLITARSLTEIVRKMEGDELSEAIRRAAGTLTKSEARLWRLFAEAGMTAAEISAITEINVRSVSTMLSHARSHIYKLLKEGGYIDG